MASIRKVEYFAVQVPNRANEGAKLLKALKAQKVNLLAFTGFPNGKTAQADFVPEKPAAFRAAARKLGLKLDKSKTGFLVQGTDRVGVVGNIMGRLGAARINVTAINAVSAGWKRFGAIFWVKPKDVARAAKVLGAR
ncbi:MAG: hypothetical protein ACRES4_04910 [Nevskiales bacterium]